MDLSVAQIIGYLALLFVILSFQKNRRIKILLIMLIGLALWVVHYSLLGAWTGSLMNLIEAITVFVAYKKEKSKWAKNKTWLYVFISAFIIVGAITYSSIIDLMPIIAQIFGTIAVYQKNPKIIRLIMIIPRPLWFTYNLMVGSYAGMAAEVLIFLSVIIGILRFDILKKKELKIV